MRYAEISNILPELLDMSTLLEQSMPLRNFIARLTGMEAPLNDHLIKLMAFDANSGMRNHWKMEILAYCRGLTNTTLKTAKGSKRAKAEQFFSVLFDDRFGEESEVDNVERICRYIMKDYPDLVRNSLDAKSIRRLMMEWHLKAATSMASQDFDADLVEKLQR